MPKVDPLDDPGRGMLKDRHLSQLRAPSEPAGCGLVSAKGEQQHLEPAILHNVALAGQQSEPMPGGMRLKCLACSEAAAANATAPVTEGSIQALQEGLEAIQLSPITVSCALDLMKIGLVSRNLRKL